MGQESGSGDWTGSGDDMESGSGRADFDRQDSGSGDWTGSGDDMESGSAGLTLIDKVPVEVLAQERVDPAPDLAQEWMNPALALACNLQYRNRQERREREQL